MLRSVFRPLSAPRQRGLLSISHLHKPAPISCHLAPPTPSILSHAHTPTAARHFHFATSRASSLSLRCTPCARPSIVRDASPITHVKFIHLSPISKAFSQSSTRLFHSSPPRSTVHGDPSTDPAGRAGSLIAQWEQWKPRIVSYLWIAAIVGTGIIVLRAGLWVVSFFSSLDFADVGEAAFFAGLLTGLGVVGVALLGRRALTLRPEAVYQDALRQVLNDTTVRSFLGSELHTGSFRAYSFLPGSLRLPGITTGTTNATSIPTPPVAALTPAPASTVNGGGTAATLLARLRTYWRPRRLQLFFQVTGNEGEHGMVSAEVEKVRGVHRYNLLCVDVLNTGQRIVLQGDPAYSIYQGVIRLR